MNKKQVFNDEQVQILKALYYVFLWEVFYFPHSHTRYWLASTGSA